MPQKQLYCIATFTTDMATMYLHSVAVILCLLAAVCLAQNNTATTITTITTTTPTTTNTTTTPPHAAKLGDCADIMLDLVYVLDASGSVTEPNFRLMLNFLKKSLSVANVDGGNVRVGVVTFSNKAYIQFHLNEFSSKRELYEAIDEVPYKPGSTNTYGGVHAMRTQMFNESRGDRRNVPNVAVVITDGLSQINSRKLYPEAEQVWIDGIHMFAIGIGLTDTTELDGLASKPLSETRFTVQKFSQLDKLREKVFSVFCTSN